MLHSTGLQQKALMPVACLATGDQQVGASSAMQQGTLNHFQPGFSFSFVQGQSCTHISAQHWQHPAGDDQSAAAPGG